MFYKRLMTFGYRDLFFKRLVRNRDFGSTFIPSQKREIGMDLAGMLILALRI